MEQWGGGGGREGQKGWAGRWGRGEGRTEGVGGETGEGVQGGTEGVGRETGRELREGQKGWVERRGGN